MCALSSSNGEGPAWPTQMPQSGSFSRQLEGQFSSFLPPAFTSRRLSVGLSHCLLLPVIVFVLENNLAYLGGSVNCFVGRQTYRFRSFAPFPGIFLQNIVYWKTADAAEAAAQWAARPGVFFHFNHTKD